MNLIDFEVELGTRDEIVEPLRDDCVFRVAHQAFAQKVLYKAVTGTAYTQVLKLLARPNNDP